MTPTRARLILVGLLAVVLIGIRGSESVAPPPRDPALQVGDLNLHQWTIERIRAGAPYYAAVGDELRRSGYPTKPIFNWRTPLHYRAVAALSIEGAGILLSGLAMTLVVTGALVYVRYSVLKSLIGALFLLGAMMPVLLVRPGSVLLAEVWTGVFIGLSLNAYVARLWQLGAVLGVVAVFTRELAAPYGLVCGLLAIHARRRHESSIWVIGGLAFGGYYALHAVAASAAIEPGDLAHGHSWVRLLGLPFVFSTLYTYGWLTLLPPPVTPMAAAFGLTAICARTVPPQVSAALVTYVIFFCIVGQPFDFYWGFLTAAIWAHAFVHGPEGTARILGAALRRPTRQHSAVAGRQSGTDTHHHGDPRR